MQTSTATQGEIKLYEKIKGFEVRGLLGNSSAGYGWRPVCGGHYLGNECTHSEKAAITQGKIFISELKRRIDSGPLAAVKKQSKKGREKNAGV